MTKAELRQQFLARRKALSARDVVQRSQLITQVFVDFLAKKNQTKKINLLHTFLPIQRQKEVDTWPIIHSIWQKFPTTQVVVSVTNTIANSLTHYPLDRHTPLIENKWGIPEPVNTGLLPIESNQIDLVLVPLLTFDQTGHRVGYGGGYYDRFLTECRPYCLKVGLSLSDPVDLIDDVEPTDIKLDVCVLPDRVYCFK